MSPHSSSHWEILSSIIRSRRTKKPVFFKDAPDSEEIRNLIEIARNAPNHHRTEPARFYLLDPLRIQAVGKQFGEITRGDGTDPQLIKKGEKKEKEWSQTPGLLIVTCYSDPSSTLASKYPDSTQEDYATVSCICQNLLLLMEAKGISAKWSTGPVWKHKNFHKTIGIQYPNFEKVVALLFYGYSTTNVENRTLSPLDDHLVDFCRS